MKNDLAVRSGNDSFALIAKCQAIQPCAGEEWDDWRGICTFMLGSRLQRWSLAASNGAGDHQSSGMRIAIRLALCSTQPCPNVLRG